MFAGYWNNEKYRDMQSKVSFLRDMYLMTKMASMIGSFLPWHSVLLKPWSGGTFFVITNEAFA